tara:strand:- start:3450 stop:3605 length:156 start_codon:yes stop_codon:yes gene_type:complete
MFFLCFGAFYYTANDHYSTPKKSGGRGPVPMFQIEFAFILCHKGFQRKIGK